MEMKMALFILFMLSAIGMSHIIIDGSIFASTRNFLKTRLPESVYTIFECYICCGFWTGVFAGMVLITFNPFGAFLCGCAGSFLSNLAASFLNLIESVAIKNMGEK